MKQKSYISFIILIFFLSCSTKKENNKSEKIFSIEKNSVTKVESFHNSFKVDTSLVKEDAFKFMEVSNSKEVDSIYSVCKCQKNKKDNSLKIQIMTAIPNQKELDTISPDSPVWNTLVRLHSREYRRKINGQFKFFTITLKDSIVENIYLYSKSTENEYNGSDFDSLQIHKYKINISKFDYSIASDIYGNLELHLNKDFGLFKNDTIIRWSFICNNWGISTKEDIKNWDIN